MVFDGTGYRESWLYISQLTIEGGYINGHGGGIQLRHLCQIGCGSPSPPAIFHINLDSLNVTNNESLGDGGGLYSTAVSHTLEKMYLNITNSTFHNNRADNGGGIATERLRSNVIANISNTTISNNQADNGAGEGRGGGIIPA